MTQTLTLPTLDCKRCGHHWYPRTAKDPRVCPKCKSPYWDREYAQPRAAIKKSGVSRPSSD